MKLAQSSWFEFYKEILCWDQTLYDLFVSDAVWYLSKSKKSSITGYVAVYLLFIWMFHLDLTTRLEGLSHPTVDNIKNIENIYQHDAWKTIEQLAEQWSSVILDYFPNEFQTMKDDPLIKQLFRDHYSHKSSWEKKIEDHLSDIKQLYETLNEE